jgi:hypothetical protein
MYIGPSQSVLLFCLLTGLAGWWRGWGREIITIAITLASVLFLVNGGITWLWQFIFYSVPQAFNQLFLGTSGVQGVQPVGINAPKPNPYGEFFLWLTFFLTVGLGYLIGHRYGGAPKSLVNRWNGFVLGVINGIVIMWYVTKQLVWGGSLTIVTPNNGLMTLWLLAALGFGLVSVAVTLFATWAARGGGGH